MIAQQSNRRDSKSYIDRRSPLFCIEDCITMNWKLENGTIAGVAAATKYGNVAVIVIQPRKPHATFEGS